MRIVAHRQLSLDVVYFIVQIVCDAFHRLGSTHPSTYAAAALLGSETCTMIYGRWASVQVTTNPVPFKHTPETCERCITESLEVIEWKGSFMYEGIAQSS